MVRKNLTFGKTFEVRADLMDAQVITNFKKRESRD